MSDPFLGDIKVVAFGFAPRGWAPCNGQLLPIQQYTALFSLLGTSYGGNGQTNFALPNLQGRVPLHAGDVYTPGAQGGEARHTLTVAEVPAHTHPVQGDGVPGTLPSPSGTVLAGSAKAAYGSTFDTTMNPLAAGTAGNSQPHQNMPPFLVMNFIICLSGIFPVRN
jgi:microcystin-dependent protein